MKFIHTHRLFIYTSEFSREHCRYGFGFIYRKTLLQMDFAVIHQLSFKQTNVIFRKVN